MELVEKLEDEGKIFVIRPLIPTVSRLEKNYDAEAFLYAWKQINEKRISGPVGISERVEEE